MRALLLALALLAPAVPAAAYDAEREAGNFAHIDGRREHEQTTAEYQAAVARNGGADLVDILARDAASGGERFSGSLCGAGILTCAGDPRTREWSGGESTPILYRNRNGAHIEGHVWVGEAFAESPAGSLPGVVLETGSVQAPERWYYWAAQVLAAHGYLVMTFDVQGQGRSDAFGSHDENFYKGFPAQDLGHFVEDLEDAIGFFHSEANPRAALLDRERLGIVGHSLGAAAVSELQATDTRVDAIVAWDNLESNVTPRVPALGMGADYGLVPAPHSEDPDPEDRNGGFARWRAAGIDAMQVNLRGATHYEWSYAPMMLPASLRGIDVAAWYTTAWLDKYVKGDPTADARLLTDRFLADPVEQAVDASEGGNLMSFYLRSPFAITAADGSALSCADLHSGCAALRGDDGLPREPAYSYLADRG